MVTFISLVFGVSLNASETPPPSDKLVVTGKSLTHGLHSVANSPFSVYVFDADAIGEYIGVILTGVEGLVVEGLPDCKWGGPSLFWQDPLWASDVTGIAWSPSGWYLYVSTSEIYGDGGLFELDLAHQKATLVTPLPEVRAAARAEGRYLSTDIVGIEGNTLIVEIESYHVDTQKHETTQERFPMKPEVLDFDYSYASSERKYHSTLVLEEFAGKYKRRSPPIVVLVETPDLSNASYESQLAELEGWDLDAYDNISFILVTACTRQEEKRGYHTSVEAARNLVKDNSYRVRLLSGEGHVLLETTKLLTRVDVYQYQNFCRNVVVKPESQPFIPRPLPAPSDTRTEKVQAQENACLPIRRS